MSPTARFLTWKGLWMIRRLRWIKRRMLWVLALLWGLLFGVWQKGVHTFWAFAVQNGLDHSLFMEKLRAFREERKRVRKRGFGPALVYWIKKLPAALSRAGKKLCSSPSYYLPVCAAAIFILTVNFTLHRTFALEVVYNGKIVGYIANESVYENAEIQMRGRIAYEDYIKPDDAIPKYSIVAVREDQLTDVNDLTDELIRASGNELAEATGLYVDGEFVGAMSDGNQLRTLLESLLAPYRTDDEDETVEFVKDVQLVEGLYPISSISSLRVLHDKVTSQEQEERIYTTVSGDAPILIAEKNGISLSLLLALNPGIEDSLLIGQEVIVQQSVPFLEVQVNRIETYDEDIAFKIERTVDSSQYEGYLRTTQVGKNGVERITARVTYLNGIETSREVISTETISEPVNEKVTVGGKSVAEVGTQATSTGFIWPAASGYVSCGLNGYRGHTGMDIASSYGTAIYAAASGIVTKVAYNTTGYGYHIIISHGGNVETLYAHCSQLFVKVGEWVTQGEQIAAMGRTGNATGVHVHFEVRSNGRYLNPANYVGSRCPY